MLSPVINSFSKFSMKPPGFTGRQPPSPMLTAFDVDPRQLLRRRSSLVVDDLVPDFKRHSLTDGPAISEEGESNGVNGHSKPKDDDKTRKLSKEEEKKKPTQFQEPDANSLLDAFGF